LEPLINLLIKMGATPNIVTTIGFFITIIAAEILIYGAETGERNDPAYITLFGWYC